MDWKSLSLGVALGFVIWFFLSPGMKLDTFSADPSHYRQNLSHKAKPLSQAKTATLETKELPPNPVKDPLAEIKISHSPVSDSSPIPPPSGLVAFVRKEKDLAVAFGDIVLGRIPEGVDAKQGTTPKMDNRLWPNARIPFEISADVEVVPQIQQALLYFQENTPVRFETALPDDHDRIVFVRAEDFCGSYLGRRGGGQSIFVGAKCGRQEIIHEIMHALGFVHEHSRVDRDHYIEINWKAIPPDFWPQFWVVPDQWVHDFQGSVFDFDEESAMLYRDTAFSTNPSVQSLVPKGRVQIRPTQEGLSRRDKERVFYLYGH